MLAAADVHVALRLAQLADEEDERTLLAAALAVRAPRLGSVCVDLADDRAPPRPPTSTRRSTCRRCRGPSPRRGSTASPRARWSPPARTAARTDRSGSSARRSTSTATGGTSASSPPTSSPATSPPSDVDAAVLADGLARLFDGEEPDLQRLAAATCVLRRLAVVGGGPGTGKTTTVTRILVLLDEQAEAAGAPPPLVALAAPTGKAAARLEEAVHEEASGARV